MAPVDVQKYNDSARDDLLQLLGSVPGKKNLVLQKSLVGRIELLSKFSTLQEQGIDRIFFLENNNVDGSQRNIVFIVSGEKAQQAQAVVAQIKRLQQTGSTDHEFTILWTPRRTLIGEKILEDEGVLGDVNSVEWSLYFHSLEKDVLSMELNESFGELYLRRDPTSIFMAAKALIRFESQHGLFPRILGKGDKAKRLTELLLRMRLEAASSSTPNATTSKALPVGSMPSVTLENLIIIDRDVDPATPLMTQLTYEGLIDETFTIRHSQTEVPASIVGQPQGTTQPSERPPSSQQSTIQHGLKRKIPLNNFDTLFSSLRDANFAIVGQFLNRVARRLQTDYSTGKTQKSVTELREFVNKLPGYQSEQQSLKIHTGLAEEVMRRTREEAFVETLRIQQNVIAGTDPSSLLETIEDLIARKCPLETALRLLCLCSVVSGGLRAKDFDTLSRQVIHAYGHHHILTLDNLEAMGLLTVRSSLNPFSFGTASSTTTTGTTASAQQKTDYATLRRTLNLIVDDVSESDPQDIAYAYSGYAPLSVRLVQCILQKPYLASLTRSSSAAQFTEPSSGWRGFEDVLKSVKGPTVDEVQTASMGARSAKARQTLVGSGGRKTSVVFFLGGITYAEIAALRFVGEKIKERGDLLICTTGVISGSGVVGSAIEAGL